jgi:hypothetical protein
MSTIELPVIHFHRNIVTLHNICFHNDSRESEIISYTIHQQPVYGPEFSTMRTLISKLKTYPEELNFILHLEQNSQRRNNSTL